MSLADNLFIHMCQDILENETDTEEKGASEMGGYRRICVYY